MEQFNGVLAVLCLVSLGYLLFREIQEPRLATRVCQLSARLQQTEQEHQETVARLIAVAEGWEQLVMQRAEERDVSHTKYCKTAKDLDSAVLDAQGWEETAAIRYELLDKVKAELKDAKHQVLDLCKTNAMQGAYLDEVRKQLKEVTHHRDHMLSQMQSWLPKNTTPEGEEARERAERMLRLSCAQPK